MRLLAGFVCAAGLVLAQGNAPVRVMVVTGGHDHDPSFYSLFEGNRAIRATVDPHPKAFSGDIRKPYDVLVLYDMVQDTDARRKQNLRDFVESGKGLVVLHHALADYTDWPWWYDEVVGGRYVLKAEPGHPASTYRHDERVRVEPVGSHPVIAGLSMWTMLDETYKSMSISPKVQVLLRTDNPTSDGPVAWISPYSKSRVVVIQLGHDRAAHADPNFRKLVTNALLWAAGR